MTDRELIELAAKAAGFQNYTMVGDSVFVETGAARGDCGYYWNPLTDDGDALRLAVQLELNLRINKFPHVVYVEIYNGRAPSVMEPLSDVRQPTPDPQVATRRAITRAAAEIGKGMK